MTYRATTMYSVLDSPYVSQASYHSTHTWLYMHTFNHFPLDMLVSNFAFIYSLRQSEIAEQNEGGLSDGFEILVHVFIPGYLFSDRYRDSQIHRNTRRHLHQNLTKTLALV